MELNAGSDLGFNHLLFAQFLLLARSFQSEQCAESVMRHCINGLENAIQMYPGEALRKDGWNVC